MINFKYTIYSKSKFYIERSIGKVILIALTLISVFTIFKTSSEPIVGFLKGSYIENYLYRFSTGNDIAFNIASSFFVSVFFYILVVYIPENRKKKDMEPFVLSKCEEIIFSSYALIKSILDESEKDYDYKTIDLDKMIEICKAVDPKMGVYSFVCDGYIFTKHFGYELNNSWNRITRQIDETFQLLSFIDSGLLKRIYKIYQNFFTTTSKLLVDPQKNGLFTLEHFHKELFDLYLTTKELRDYYVFYSKKEFPNDPWK